MCLLPSCLSLIICLFRLFVHFKTELFLKNNNHSTSVMRRSGRTRLSAFRSDTLGNICGMRSHWYLKFQNWKGPTSESFLFIYFFLQEKKIGFQQGNKKVLEAFTTYHMFSPAPIFQHFCCEVGTQDWSPLIGHEWNAATSSQYVLKPVKNHCFCPQRCRYGSCRLKFDVSNSQDPVREKQRPPHMTKQCEQETNLHVVTLRLQGSFATAQYGVSSIGFHLSCTVYPILIPKPGGDGDDWSESTSTLTLYVPDPRETLTLCHLPLSWYVWGQHPAVWTVYPGYSLALSPQSAQRGMARELCQQLIISFSM